ncbi:hypothetical protein G6L94_19275 [Agrobacterium rhizogenes]|jgi:hypothetical protein|uniref:hypothetical protein n=1 Tax=Rhizobium rhizogenes TaxID=359 RepID=UPI00055CFC3C|nr:hypothetical protein [Rhizobium rhizogenes]OCJ24892.1 hypothetical protein A6U89_30495 [Agrobacterium sp. B133/95]NTI17596.1 hypothetical protein [Rhizobium rhizogenes]NTI50470.1 hypothetical protein [Rhizobium rhizogenes]NTI95839.1 hypothetical protein [Rhizobium rhizogenes]NTJ58308.1 hypothetical protein [Rhizobium rhizogenes]
MSTDDFFTDQQIHDFFMKGLSWGVRVLRGVAYFGVALMLLRSNSYGLLNQTSVAIAIGILGAGSASARLAQTAIAVLLFMAILPIGIFGSLRALFG